MGLNELLKLNKTVILLMPCRYRRLSNIISKEPSKSLKSSGIYMCFILRHEFCPQNVRIYGFCVIMRTNSYYSPIEHVMSLFCHDLHQTSNTLRVQRVFSLLKVGWYDDVYCPLMMNFEVSYKKNTLNVKLLTRVFLISIKLCALGHILKFGPVKVTDLKFKQSLFA